MVERSARRTGAGRALRGAGCGAILMVLGGCASDSKLHEAEMAQLLTLLPGHYDNGAQADSDAAHGVRPAHEKVVLVIARVYTPRLGHHLFYAQEMAADDPRRVLSQKMYSFTVEDKRGIVATLYQFVDPLRWRDGQQNPDLFTSVVTEDVQAEGCQLLWKKSDAGFVADYDPKVCPGSKAPQAELGVGTLSIGDYHFRKSH